ncbi:MAG: rod shape-determining protein [Anaerolineae bacterium]|nr:MAG: rod shape-determining protein [Anaerolineae bacterium]
MGMFSKELGIDLGTMFTRIAEDGVVILEEPSVVSVDIDRQIMVALGREAQGMIGRVDAEQMQVTRILQHGVVAFYEYTEKFLEALVKRIGGGMGFLRMRPNLMITHPFGITSVERRAVQEAALSVGDARLVPQPVAAALGVDLPIGTPSGNMIVLLGAGASQAAVIAMHTIVSGETLRIGGLDLDEAIVTYVRRKYGLIIGLPTAEQVKLRIGAAIPLDEELSIDIQGQDQVSGLPKPLTLTTGEIVEAVEDTLDQIFETVRRVLEKTQPELASDIIDRGIALCGGAALLRGMDKLMTQNLGVPVYLVDNPLSCVAEGACRAHGMYDLLNRNLPQI